MANLSISIPDDIARKSFEVAKSLGISKAQFLRQAIARELAEHQPKVEQVGIVKSFEAMKKSAIYLEESNSIMGSLNSELVQDPENWWVKKPSNITHEYLNSISKLLSEWSSPEDDEAYRNL